MVHAGEYIEDFASRNLARRYCKRNDRSNLLPLALRQEQCYLPCRSTWGVHVRTEHRSSTRHAGSLNPANSSAWSPARLGYFRAHSPGLQQSSPGPAGVLVSGAAPPRAPRLDQGALGRIGEQSPREILRTHQEWAETARSGKERMEETGGGRRPGVRDGLGTFPCSRTQGVEDAE